MRITVTRPACRRKLYRTSALSRRPLRTPEHTQQGWKKCPGTGVICVEDAIYRVAPSEGRQMTCF